MVLQTWRVRVAKDTIFDTVRSLAKQEVRVLLTGLSLQRFVLRKCEVHMLALRDPAQLSICGDIETCGLRVTHESLYGVIVAARLIVCHGVAPPRGKTK